MIHLLMINNLIMGKRCNWSVHLFISPGISWGKKNLDFKMSLGRISIQGPQNVLANLSDLHLSKNEL